MAASSQVPGSHIISVQPVTLEREAVRLVPLSREHIPLLWEAAKNDLADIFRWIPYRVQDYADLEQMVLKALDEQSRGVSLPFATLERSSGTVIGSTRFMNIDVPNRRVEIGSTWIAPAWQRTAINTEAKYLMLSHAFDQWGCIRVELKTDVLNQKSRNAILRIGAKEEGTLRHHMITHSGRLRDTVYFSILKFEWPHVRCRIAEKISQGGVKAGS
ncbi:MAG TPA: GNAT family protein [Terriglobales bacterium]|nr:GNAT family protein [Terriglobales bacterium]